MARKTLSDTQLVLLSAASQREDHLIAIHDRLKGGAAIKVAESLIASHLAEEIAAPLKAPRWRLDDDQRPLGLRITAAGLAAIGFESEDSEPSAQAASPSSVEDRHTSGATPRSGSKLASVIGMLSCEEGASIIELTNATGWQPHTTRAAITGLRKRGYDVERVKDDSGASRYRLAVVSGSVSEGAA